MNFCVRQRKREMQMLAAILDGAIWEEFVWCGAEFPVDEELASRLIKESVRLGSADGVLCALRTGNLSPAVRKTMPFASLEEAFMTV